MLTSIIASYLPYAVVAAFTPGPNNFVSFYAVSRNGWRKGKNVLLGIASGILVVMSIGALFCYELARYIPAAARFMKYVGAAYIAWLAFRVAMSGPEEGEGRQMTFRQGFLLEFVNVKIMLFGITVYTGYVLPYDASLGSLLLHGVCLTAICSASLCTWGAAGRILHRFIAKYYRPFNILMGLILFWCALSLILG